MDPAEHSVLPLRLVPRVGRVADIALQPASRDIWDSKYRLRTKAGEPLDLDIDDTYRRVARTLADVEATPEAREHWFGRFHEALRRGAIPAGRIISNAGAQDHKPATSTINCTVSAVVRDSMDDILSKVHEAGLTLKAGCGIGYEFSTLRPRGAWVSGAGAQTSGPLSFMDIYDAMCFTVSSAGGRRGAQMATFDVGHPDVMEFIRAKREDGRLRQFNLSLLITREFVEAVREDRPWKLAFPMSASEREQLDLDDPEQVVWRHWPAHFDSYTYDDEGRVACRVYRALPARRMWDAIMSSTYDFAEPGFVLIDEINEMNNNWFCEEIRATNPCVTADTWVHTSGGPRQVAELVGRPFEALVDGSAHPTDSRGFFPTGRKRVVDLETEEGYRLTLTPDHRVRRVAESSRFAMQTEWTEAASLRPGDEVVLHEHREAPEWDGPGTEGEGYLVGLLVGDGTLQDDAAVLSAWPGAVAANGGHERPGVAAIMDAAWVAARSLPHRADFRGWHAVPGRGEYRMKLGALKRLAADLGLRPGTKAVVTPAMHRCSAGFQRGFLRGLFDSDGSVQGDRRKGVSVRLAQSDERLLVEVQRMLLRAGVVSRLYRSRRAPGTRSLPDGRGGSREYGVESQPELVIARENLPRFERTVGFRDADKAGRLAVALAGDRRAFNRERFTATVRVIEPAGEAEVFDVSVPGVNAFDANGLYAHNCGEQPLPPYGSCLLGSVNLTGFVREPFTENARFDWEGFRETVAVFTRMLDNVVEINGLPLEEQRREITAKRRHGMGFLGLGSALALLGLRYGSAESLAFTSQVSRELAVTGWKAALELAEEKGPAPILEEEFEVTPAMLAARPEMAKDGVRAGDRVPGRVLHARYSRYMQRIAESEPELVERLAAVGARFTHHSSIAPTGTISLSLANNASNGIEPSFAHHYSRNVIRSGRKTKEKVDVWSFELLAYRELVNPEAEGPGDLPDCFVSSSDITPREHVDVQAAAQVWVDSSISKTANVPTDFPYESFKDIYLYAMDKGLKGCTTFRFNPENFQGVLVKEQDLENTWYTFTTDDGREIRVRGNEEIEYDGETHTAANLYDALKEGYYGKF